MRYLEIQYYLLLMVSILLLQSCGNSAMEQENTAPISSKDVHQINDTLLSNAIDKGFEYIEQQGDNFDPLLFPILEYILAIDGRKMELPFKAAYTKYIEKEDYYDKVYLPIYMSYKEGFKQIVSEDFRQLDELPAGVAKVFLCEEIPINNSIIPIIEQIAKDSFGYGMTHALLMLKWIEDKQCLDLNTNLLIDNYAYCLPKIINKPSRILNDLQLEAAAISYYIQKPSLVDGKIIDKIIMEQDQSGVWIINADAGIIANHHPTVMALWALIGYKNKNKKHRLWLNRKISG